MKKMFKKISTMMILLTFAMSNTVTMAGAKGLKNLLSLQYLQQHQH